MTGTAGPTDLTTAADTVDITTGLVNDLDAFLNDFRAWPDGVMTTAIAHRLRDRLRNEAA